MFEKASITLENGRVFTIEAIGNSPENVYIQAATLNGNPLTRSWISYDEIMQGGILKFKMGSTPEQDTRNP